MTREVKYKNMAQEKTNNAYNAEQIQILEGLEPVRLRPGMYIGSTGEKGLHHLVYEIVDNSVDEALAGFCDEIKVAIEKDNSITVEDNGRGMPVDTRRSDIVSRYKNRGRNSKGDGRSD